MAQKMNANPGKCSAVEVSGERCGRPATFDGGQCGIHHNVRLRQETKYRLPNVVKQGLSDLVDRFPQWTELRNAELVGRDQVGKLEIVTILPFPNYCRQYSVHIVGFVSTELPLTVEYSSNNPHPDEALAAHALWFLRLSVDPEQLAQDWVS